MEPSDKVEDISNGADIVSLNYTMKDLRRVRFSLMDYIMMIIDVKVDHEHAYYNHSLNTLCITMSTDTRGHICYFSTTMHHIAYGKKKN